MILPVYLSKTKHADLIARLEAESNRSGVVRVALQMYYSHEDAEADLLQELAVQIAKVDSDIVRLCTMIAKMLDLEPIEEGRNRMNNDAEIYATFTEWCNTNDIVVQFRKAFWHYLAGQAANGNVPNDPEVWQAEWENWSW